MKAFVIFGSLLIVALLIVLVVGTVTAAFEPNGKDFRIVEITTDNKFVIYCKNYLGKWIPLFNALKKSEHDDSILVINQKGTKKVDVIKIEEAVKVLDDMMAKLRESNQRKKGDNKRIIKDYKV